MTALPVVATPFPHAIVDDWWDDGLLQDVLDEFPDVSAPGWRRYTNVNERKLEGPPRMWGERMRDLINLIEDQAPVLEAAFGIEGLQMETIGGGYHCIEPGGHLQVHTDFNRSPKTRRFRRLNLLVFLNRDWHEPMGGGDLELWNAGACEVAITPEFNRTVVFETSSRSWHGHPMPARRIRRSVAAYFYTDIAPPGYTCDHSTTWHE